MLSIELSRARALLAGGSPAATALELLRGWELKLPERGRGRVGPSLLRWSARLRGAVADALPLGAPVGRLLRETQPMIRAEERLWTRLGSVERQFALQGAIAVVLPWAVAALTGPLSLNALSVAGLVFQLVGLALFAVVVRRATRLPAGESAWLFDFLVSTWMRVLAGLGLRAALEAALADAPAGPYRSRWLAWAAAWDSGALRSGELKWPADMTASRELGPLLASLLRAGAPAADALADLIAQLSDERLALLEERLAGVPTRLSLLFTGLLAPAVFLVLMGGLWPLLKETTW